MRCFENILDTFGRSDEPALQKEDRRVICALSLANKYGLRQPDGNNREKNHTPRTSPTNMYMPRHCAQQIVRAPTNIYNLLMSARKENKTVAKKVEQHSGPGH